MHHPKRSDAGLLSMKAGVRMKNFRTASECRNCDLHDYFMKITILIASVCHLTDCHIYQRTDY